MAFRLLLSLLSCTVMIRFIEAQCLRGQVNCADIEYAGQAWGRTVYGFDIGKYTSQQLQFLGCGATQTPCSQSTIYCTQTSTSMSFGRTGQYAMEALLGPGEWPTSFIDTSDLCATSSRPRQLLNAPEDYTKLCNYLGYNAGSGSAMTFGCPKVTWDYLTNSWTSNYNRVMGAGQQYTCSDPCTANPTESPTDEPSINPSGSPTNIPTETTRDPSTIPTGNPTQSTSNPSANPSSNPTEYPSSNPSVIPTLNPSFSPTLYPTEYPSSNPSEDPSLNPTKYPSLNPSLHPTEYPSEYPSSNPSYNPTSNPSRSSSNAPSVNPSDPLASTSATLLDVVESTEEGIVPSNGSMAGGMVAFIITFCAWLLGY